jgi:hypothetical protein
MQRPVYFLECGCVDTFKLFSRDRQDYAEDEAGWRLNRAMNDLHTNQLTFVFYRPLEPKDMERLNSAGLAASPLISFPGADAYLESYYIYRITRSADVRPVQKIATAETK